MIETAFSRERFMVMGKLQKSLIQRVIKKKNDPISANDWIVRKISGAVLLSHSQIYSTIAAGALNYRVREGNVCDSSAMDTGKKIHNKKMFEDQL